MSNLTRYHVKFHSNRYGGPVFSFFEDHNGEYVKFDDIKEFLKPTANNDYTAAIRCFDEWESLLLAGKNCNLNFRDHCKHRLNSALQHCA